MRLKAAQLSINVDFACTEELVQAVWAPAQSSTFHLQNAPKFIIYSHRWLLAGFREIIVSTGDNKSSTISNWSYTSYEQTPF